MSSEEKKDNKVKIASQKFAEDWLPVKDIRNGEIILDNGYSVTGIKIKPRNIFILENNNLIFFFRVFRYYIFSLTIFIIDI